MASTTNATTFQSIILGAVSQYFVPLAEVPKQLEYEPLGVVYFQHYDAIPSMKPWIMDWEKGWDLQGSADFMNRHWEVPAIACTLYLFGIWYGTKVMRDRKPFDLRLALTAWNLGLSIFSFFGAARLVPALAYNIAEMGFTETLCGSAASMYGAGVQGVWTKFFIYSKIPELIDTAFIVLRKKKLIFLHWYHHLTVLLYCWLSYSVELPMGLYFSAMNYTVHAIMYLYFAATAQKLVPKWFPSWLITVLQISQMIVGIAVSSYALYYANFRSDIECPLSPAGQIGAVLMYGSYFALFLDFFIKRFMKAPKKVKHKAQ